MKTIKKIFILITILFVSVPALAKDNIVFKCKTKDNKILSITEDKNNIYYSYGQQNKPPDVYFSNSKKEASTTQWDGTGNSIDYSIDMDNKNIGYTIYSSANKANDDDNGEASVSAGALIGGDNNSKEDRRIECDMKSDLYINEIEGIDLPASE